MHSNGWVAALHSNGSPPQHSPALYFYPGISLALGSQLTGLLGVQAAISGPSGDPAAWSGSVACTVPVTSHPPPHRSQDGSLLRQVTSAVRVRRVSTATKQKSSLR